MGWPVNDTGLIRPGPGEIQEFFVTSGDFAGGAAGDGITDDTVAIQTALTAAGSSPNRTVIFPSGSSFIIGLVTVPSGIVIRAYGSTIKLKNGSNSSMMMFANAAHVDTTFQGGIWDGNGVNQTSTSPGGNGNAVINAGGLETDAGASLLTLNRVRFLDMTVLNAGRHGFRFNESGAGSTTNPKWVQNCVVSLHGLASPLGHSGFGYYMDHCPYMVFEGCYCTTNISINGNYDDNFEIGHEGQCTLIGCISINGQIQFPFADETRIIGCLQTNNTIKNDTNTANHVLIEGCTVLSCPVSGAFAGITVYGSYARIKNNRVQVTVGDGIQGATQLLTDSIIEGNVVETTVVSPAGKGISTGGTSASTGNQVRGNVIFGRWDEGVRIQAANNSIIGNTLDLTAATATYGIRIQGSNISGILANNTLIEQNQILGSPTNPVWLAVGGGALTGNVVRDNSGANPQGTVTTPAISTSLLTNKTGYDVMVFITTGGSNSITAISINGVATGQTVPISSTAKFVGILHAAGTIQLTSSGSLTGTSWLWVGSA